MSELKIPDSWAEINLPKIADLKNGQTPKGLPAKKSQGTIPFIKVSDMNSPENTSGIQTSNILLTEDDLKKYGLKSTPKYSIIFPKNGGALLTNKKRYTTMPSAVDTNIMIAIPPIKIFSYFWCWFQTVDFNNYASGSTVPMISFNDIKNIKVPLPPLQEQKRIVDCLTSLDDLITFQTHALETLKTHKKGLMQQLFPAARGVGA